MIAKKISSPVWLIRKWNKYKTDEGERFRVIETRSRSGELIKDKKVVPMTMTGFCVYIDVGYSTWKDFVKSDRAKEGKFPEYIDKIKAGIRKDQLEGAMMGIYKENISIRLAELADNQLVKNQQLPPPQIIDSVAIIHPMHPEKLEEGKKGKQANET